MVKCESIKIKVETETEKLDRMIDKIRKLKFEVIELKKQGISKRNINKMFKIMCKK